MTISSIIVRSSARTSSSVKSSLQFMVRDLVAKFIYYDDFNLARDEEIFTFLWVKNKEGKREMVGMHYGPE